MATQNIVNLSNGKIDPKYIPTIAPPATPTLNEVLTAGNTTDGILINAHGGNVVCDAMKCISIEAATAPLFNEIAVDADLITAQFGKTGFSADALITCNEANIPKKVIETTNASTNAVYKIAEGNINYDTSNKLLTVNPVGFPPSPLLVTQGLAVVGKIDAQNGGITANNGNVFSNNGILITKEASQPRVEFQDGGGTTQAQIGYNTSNGRTILQGSNVLINTDNTNKYSIGMGDAQGYLGLETKGVDTEFRHYNSDASIMETRVRVNGGGNMSIGGQYNGSLFLESAGGGTYAGINIGAGNELTLFSGGGNIIANQTFTPSGGIADTTNSTGNAGDVLLKNGSNQLTWTTLTGGWAGTALSDLNMNGFNITAPTDIGINASNITLTSVSNVEIGAGAGGFYRCGNNTVAGVGAEIVADDGIMLQAINTGVSIDGPYCAKYINPQSNTINISYLDRLITPTIGAPMTYNGKTGGMVIPQYPAVADKILESPPVFWLYSGTANGSGLQGDSAFCSSKKVEISLDFNFITDIQDSVMLGLILRDDTASVRYHSENAYSFDNMVHEQPDSFTTFGQKNYTGGFTYSGTITSIFETAGIVDGSNCMIEVWAIGLNTSQSINNIRYTFRVRPVRDWV